MRHSLTLVRSADGDRPPLDAAVIDRVVALLATLELTPEATWTTPGVACDLDFTAGESEGLRQRLAPDLDRLLDPLRVDRALQPSEGRRKRLLVADMESTVIANEMLDELADWIGVRDQVADITARAMRGELDFHAALRQRVGLLEGLEASVLDDAGKRITIDSGAATLVATLRRDGVRTVLCSGGFTVYTRWVAERLGFDAESANQLEIRDGRLTGQVIEPILDRHAKVDTLRHHCDALGIDPREAVAVGDGANDVPLLQTVGLGVAYHAKPAVDAAARFRVRHGDLSTLLHYLGYRADDLVEVGTAS